MKSDSNSSNDQSKMLKKYKTSMREKLSDLDFMLDLKNALSDSKLKDPLSYVYKLIKKGFKEMITPNHLNQICQLIFPWEYFPPLALKLAIEVSTGRPTGLIRRLMDLVRREAARRTTFPLEKTPLVTNVPDPDRRSVLEDWIRANSLEGPLDAVWARNALVCLISANPSYDEFSLIQFLLEQCSAIKKKKKPSTSSHRMKKRDESDKYEKYTKQVSGFFTSKKFTPSKVSFGLYVSRIFQDKLEKMELNISNLEDTLFYEKRRSSELREKLDLSEKELKETLRDIPKLKEEIKSKDDALIEEKARVKNLDEHWQRRFNRELKGQAYNFRKFLEHEIREVKLSLNRKNPNIQMALDRIKNTEAYLKNLGETV